MELTDKEVEEVKKFFSDGPVYVEYAEIPKNAVARKLGCSGRVIYCLQRDKNLLIYRIIDNVLSSTGARA